MLDQWPSLVNSTEPNERDARIGKVDDDFSACLGFVSLKMLSGFRPVAHEPVLENRTLRNSSKSFAKISKSESISEVQMIDGSSKGLGSFGRVFNLDCSVNGAH